MDVKEVWGKAWSLRPGQNTTNMKCVGTIIKSGMSCAEGGSPRKETIWMNYIPNSQISMADRYNIGGTINIPYYDEETSSIKMAYADEFTELTSTSGNFGSISLGGFLAGALTLISKKLINNSNFDVLNKIIQYMAKAISVFIEHECLIGTTGKAEGLTKVTRGITAAAADKVKADELIDVQESIPDTYQSGAVWIMNKATRTAIRKLKDMNINTSFISNNNSYAGQTPVYIVIHNTDNYAQGANAKAHAKAQHDGNFKGYSAHVFVDDTEAYQALPYDRGAWHVGVNYGGRLFGTVNNRNAVGIEMCVQEGYNYEKAFQNTVQICKQIMKQLGIPADRVVQHYDVCAKNCPSAIRAKCDWNRFKQLIGAKTTTATVDKYYHTRKSWADSKSQIGAYKSLENAKKEWKEGYTIYDWNGKAVYPVEKTSAITLTKEIKVQLPVIKKGSSGAAVSSLQAVLGVEVDGSFGNDTETSLKVFQKNVAITADGSCGTDTWTKVFEHMKANTK